MREEMNISENELKQNNLPSKEKDLLCDILRRMIGEISQNEEKEVEEEDEKMDMVKGTAGNQEKRCYTVQDLQDILGISRPTVYDLLKKKEFRWILIGTKYRISKQSFDEWLDKKMEG